MFHDLRIFVLTVGEKWLPDVLRAIKSNTPEPYKLTVWYDSCGRPVQSHLVDEIKRYTDDWVLLSKNHGGAEALGFAMLYLKGKFILHVPGDCEVQPGYLEKLRFSFDHFPNVACAGNARVDDHPEFVPEWDFRPCDGKYFVPDGVLLFSKKAINSIGGIDASFNNYSLDQREWGLRAMKHDWNLVACKGINKEFGDMHTGRKLNPDLQKDIDHNTKAFCKIIDNGHRADWWADKKDEEAVVHVQ